MGRILPWFFILTGLILIGAGALCWDQEVNEPEPLILPVAPEPLPAGQFDPAPSLAVSPHLSPAISPTPTPAPKPVRIVIPVIGVDAPVVEVGIEIVYTEKGPQARWQTADYAAGHHSTSASPGEKGNIVISGHNNIKGKVFQRLWELKPGDKVFLYNSEGEIFLYEVREVLLLREKGVSEEQRRANARYMDPTPDETLTLISCWPPRGNTHRVIVIAKPVRDLLYRKSIE